MLNVSLWSKVAIAFIAGAIIAGLATAAYFLILSNDKLENEVEELRNTRNALITEVEKVSAEGERLKAQALQQNVFLK
jgi:hypothetical protein